MKILKKFYFFIPPLIFLVLYYPSIFYTSAWGDDPMVINPSAKDFKLMLKTFLGTSFAGDHYIPLFYLNCFLINKIFGENAFHFGFHLYQYLSQAIVCFLAPILIFEITRSRLISLLVSVFWAVHPINVQACTRLLIGPATMPSTICTFLYMLCYLRCREIPPGRLKLILIILGNLFLFISFLFAESNFLFALIITFIYFCFEGKKIFTKNYFHLLYPFIFIYPLYFVFRYLATGGNVVTSSEELLRWTEMGSISDILFRIFWFCPQLVFHYLKLFFYPFGLVDSASEWYEVAGSLFSPYSIFCQVLVLVLFLATFFAYKKFPLFSIGMIWFFLSLALVIQVIPLFSIVALRYCYMPSLGLILAICGLNFWKSINIRILIPVLFSIFMFFIFRTIYYLPSSKDFLNQYVYCAKEAPIWNKPQFIAKSIEKAKEEGRDNELPEWINQNTLNDSIDEWINKYLNLKPDLSIKNGPMQMAYNFYIFRGIFLFLYNSGQIDKLNMAINTALKIKNNWLGYYELASFYGKNRLWEKAWDALNVAIKHKPKYRFSYDYQFLEIALNANKFKEAEGLILNYIKLDLNSSYPYLFAAWFYKEAGDFSKSLMYFKEGIKKDKIVSLDSTGLYIAAHDLFLENNMLVEAREALNIVYSYDPFNEKVKEKISIVENLEKKV